MNIFGYRLVDRVPVKNETNEDFLAWSTALMANPHLRIVAQNRFGNITISTVFMGLTPDMLFETMVFYGNKDGVEKVYKDSTWEAAERRHRDVIIELFGHDLLAEREKI